MSTYGLIMRNMNHILTYQTILCIINPHVDIWTLSINYMSTHETITCNINHMLTNGTIMRTINSYADIWIYNAHYTSICRHIIMCSILLYVDI